MNLYTWMVKFIENMKLNNDIYVDRNSGHIVRERVLLLNDSR